ncbi:synaptotagmin-like protein 4 isoform X2 [Thalassophryne amazonica]|uniref:synaptotagmin-like protein 4 isoform X2 n=1 Tax=Thalassophryne amazonica TaxID=390379 RepID=UPI001471F3DC|nr:synaptotagmin-like protein 4 isoform X2 [Thalassophryne amazonica]
MPQSADTLDLDLNFLTDGEHEQIMEVLRRDEMLRHTEELRVRKLKTDLLEVKRQGAKRGNRKYSQNTCGRCQEPLSRISLFSGQCKLCNHSVCQRCRVARTNGSWLCTVCSKEIDLKKMAGEWFCDQRFNRYSTKPGHKLVRSSLYKRPQLNRHKTVGDVLLRGTAGNLNAPVPHPRQNNPIKGQSSDSGSICSRDSFDSKGHPQRSDSGSAENSSLSSIPIDSEPVRLSPALARRMEGTVPSSLTVPLKAGSDGRYNSISDISSIPEVRIETPSPELDVERMFKKSVRRTPKPAEHASLLDLRDDKSENSLENRRHSVPGLVIQSALGSMMSIYSEAGDYDSVDVSGDIVFSLKYDEHTQSLHVFIKQCQGLADGDTMRHISNPYVKCYLLPDKSRQSKRKTNTKRHTVNPVYNETLKYSISRSQLFTRSLLLSVWHHSHISRNAFLGEVEIPLDSRDLDSDQEERLPLAKASSAPATAFAQYKGELVISLKYITPKTPTADKIKGKKTPTQEGGELHVLIKEAKNLMPMKVGGTTDSFVKGYLLPGKAKATKRKTPVLKKNLNPHYDHTFVYKSLTLDELDKMCLELTVWDREVMLSNEFLGGVRLSSGKGTVNVGKEEVQLDSVGEEVSLWQKMMQYPDSWAEGSLPLRSSMGRVTKEE